MWQYELLVYLKGGAEPLVTFQSNQAFMKPTQGDYLDLRTTGNGVWQIESISMGFVSTPTRTVQQCVCIVGVPGSSFNENSDLPAQ